MHIFGDIGTTESRCFPRMKFSIPVNIYDRGLKRGFGKILDVSVEGVRVQLHGMEVVPGGLREVGLSPKDGTMPDPRLTVLVAWQKGNEFGGAFIKPQAFYALRRLVPANR